ncbi:MAG: hypothetical protein QM527_01235 [Alphaproteobacteria bacterium]|nr:hypothetical protein [Alphaproteobacteria bacterium]MDI9329941.1 hypothetical protein [Alphaproteobacteria bacterium]
MLMACRWINRLWTGSLAGLAMACGATVWAQAPESKPAPSVHLSPDSRSLDFAKNFHDHCLTQLDDLQSWRTRLNKRFRSLPPAQAFDFLSGQVGNAWYVPSVENEGNMVLIIWAQKDFCALFGRRTAMQDTEHLFKLLVARAPLPYVSTLIDDVWMGEGAERRHTFSYVWSIPETPGRILFTLTMTESDRASIQALASATRIR